MLPSIGTKRPLHLSRIVAGGMSLLGLILVPWSSAVAHTDYARWMVSGVLLTAGLLTALIATKLERLESGLVSGLAARLSELENGLVRDIGLTKEFSRIGLIEACADASTYDYGRIISESKKLVILLNDGRTWISVHRDRLRRRFADSAKETVVYLVHPDSPMVGVLARKAGRDVPALQGRIRETVEILNEIREPQTALEILGHHLFNPHSLVIGDDMAVLTPYFASRGGRTVPAFRFEDTGADCFLRDIVEDLERLRLDSASIAAIGSPAQTRQTPDVLRFKS